MMFTHLKYIGLVTIVAASFNVWGAIELASFILGGLSIMFYGLAFRLFAGISQTAILKEFDLPRMVIVYMINLTTIIGVSMSPYYYVAIFALPWMIIQTLINTVSLLVRYDIIGIQENDKD